MNLRDVSSSSEKTDLPSLQNQFGASRNQGNKFSKKKDVMNNCIK